MIIKKYPSIVNSPNTKFILHSTLKRKYYMNINSSKIDRLFDILKQKEHNHKTIFDKLNIISFEKLINDSDNSSLKDNENSKIRTYSDDIEKYLIIDKIERKVKSSQNFERYLMQLSDENLYRKVLPKKKITQVNKKKLNEKKYMRFH